MAQWSAPGRVFGLEGITIPSAQRPLWAAPGQRFTIDGAEYLRAQRAIWAAPGQLFRVDGVENFSAQLYFHIPGAVPVPAAAFVWGTVG